MSNIVLFRRDLRLEDQTAWRKAVENKKPLYPVFILDPRQLGSPYRSEFSVSFMIQSLKELHQSLQKLGLKLHLFYGEAEAVLKKLLSHKFEGLYLNKDYTPFSLKRDQAIEALCKEQKVSFHSFDDVTLLPPGQLLNLQERPYTVFTPFYKKALLERIERPKTFPKDLKLAPIKAPDEQSIDDLEKLCKLQFVNSLVKGGRKEALEILKSLKHFEDYKTTRDIPSLHGTTRLSAHNKFGTVSIREVYWAVRDLFGVHHTLINELFWRDFYTHILFHFPYVLGHSFQKKYENLKWQNDPKKIEAWKKGLTGFPIVDAGMRELNTTGWMHNRVRMITASFLIKDLHVDWRIGEQYFATKLVDYDPAVNNGSWQWAASTGCDAQPYFRIFNPWLQQKRFDPDAEYIKKWVEELRDVPLKEIHNSRGSLTYPSPIVDHKIASEKAKELYSRL